MTEALDSQSAGGSLLYFATPVTLGLRTYLTILPVALAAAAFAVPGASGREVLAWLGAGVLAEVGVAACFAGGWWVTSRLRDPRVTVIAVVLFAYAVRGGVLAAVTTFVEVPDTTSPALRVVASMLNMSLWTLLVGAGWEARAQYRRELRAAGQRLSQVRTGGAGVADSDVALALEVSSVQRDLSNLLEQYDGTEVDAWAASLQRAIDDDLRPLSHRLAAASRQPLSRRMRLRQILWRAGQQRVSWIPILVILLLSTTTNSLLRYPASEAFVIIVMYTLVLLPTVGVIAVLGLSSVPRLVVNALALVTIAVVVPVGLAAIVESLLPRQPDPLAPTGLALASLTVIVVAAIVQSAVAIARVNLKTINDELDALDLVIEGHWRSRTSASGQTAEYLHNIVQSRMTAVRIEASASTSSLDPDLLAQAQRMVVDAVGLSRHQADPVQELEQAVLAWAGVITVDLHLDERLPRDDARVARLASFAQEAIANAVRHGEATEVEVWLWCEGERIVCRVRDNGIWATPAGSGIGLAASHDLALDVTTDAEGTTVTASLR